eukprot:317177_1
MYMQHIHKLQQMKGRFIISTSTHPFSVSTEQWRDIPGCSKYSVSSIGNVKIKKSNRYLYINIPRFRSLNKLAQVALSTDLGTRKNFSLNRLVLNTFQPNPDNDDLYALRKDGDKYNNSLTNLYWSNTTSTYLTKLISVQMKHEIHGDLKCESINQCVSYLKSVDIHVSRTAVTTWCKNKSTKHGYQFEWQDATRYETTPKQVAVVDLENEEWKCFYVTPAMGVKRYVSSYGRL